MVEEMDYVLVPEELWTRLRDTFGLVEGQEPISRTVRHEPGFSLHVISASGFLNLMYLYRNWS
jgi:hypothetical protein